MAMAPTTTHRVYIGMINKKNSNELQKRATDFLRRQKVNPAIPAEGKSPEKKGYRTVVPYAQGFIVSFSTGQEARDCIEKCEDAALPDAVGGKAMARLTEFTEDEIPTIARLEKELWVTVDAERSAGLEECDSQVVALAKFYYQHGLMKKMPATNYRKLEEYLEDFIDLPNPDSRKYTIQLASSEAVMVAQALHNEQYEEAGFQSKLSVRPVPSHACSFKHRYDIYSTLIYLPSDYRAIFEEEKINKWMEPMREKLGMEVKSFRHKVVQPRIWQLFTPSERERDAFIQNLDTVCGPYVYKDASVRAVPMFWLLGMVHRWAPSLLPAEVTMTFSYRLEAFPEDLRVIRLKEQQAIEAQPDERWYNDPDISSDAQYDDISRNRDPIEFLVKRDPKRAGIQETIQFYDVFVMTVGDEQQALKRTNTLDNFRNVELKRFVDTYGKAYGKSVTEILLNYYLSFDTLGGICFYFVFDDKQAAARLVEDVASGKMYIKNQIQQHAGAKMRTEVKVGEGFKILFRPGEVEVPQDLKQISEEIVHS